MSRIISGLDIPEEVESAINGKYDGYERGTYWMLKIRYVMMRID